MSESKFNWVAVAGGVSLVVTSSLPAAAQDRTYAHSEQFFDGTLVEGDYQATHVDDGVYESIQEVESGGKPSSRTSYLAHLWEFDVPAGTSQTFFVEGATTDAGEGDGLKFWWSDDDVDYWPLLTYPVEASGELLSATLPPDVSGMVLIWMEDADRTKGNRVLDILSVDWMYIETGSTAGPPAAPTGLSATAQSDTSIALSWSDNASNEDGFRVERSADGLYWEIAQTLGPDETSCLDDGLAPATAYDYVVYAFNTYGDSDPSNLASATTYAPSTFTAELIQPDGVWPALALDPWDVPGMAYTVGGALEFALWDGLGWSLEVVDPGAVVQYSVQAEFSPTGVAACSYIVDGSLRFAEQGGTTWQTAAIAPVSFGRRTGLDYDSLGNPAIAYGVIGHRGVGDLCLARRFGGTWTVEVIDAGGTGDSDKSLAFDASGHPAIAYGMTARKNGGSINKLKFARWNGSAWEIEIVEEGVLYYGAHPVLAFDPLTGWPVIANTAAPGETETRILRWNGSSWDLEVFGPGWPTDLGFDDAGGLHLAYRTMPGDELWYAFWNGSDWQHERVAPRWWSGGSMQLDSAGQPSLAFEGKLGEIRGTVYAFR